MTSSPDPDDGTTRSPTGSSPAPGLRFPFALFLAVVAGAGATHLLLSTRPAPTSQAEPTRNLEDAKTAPAPRTARRPEPRRLTVPAVPSEAELQALRDEVTATEMHLALLQGQWESVAGKAHPWTDEVRADDRPEAVRNAIHRGLATLEDAELVLLDCDEYPCIMAVHLPVGVEDNQTLNSVLNAIHQAWEPLHGQVSVGVVPSSDGTQSTVFLSLYDHLTDDPEALDLRVEVRRERQQALLRQARRAEGEE